jgi:hypothetical protein|tara:strand:- start:101 stop:283 length:183 start_codon:yes stop_codon:yes gene_type:complete
MMQYIPPAILDRIVRREQRKREQMQERLRLPLPLPIPLHRYPEVEKKEEKDGFVIIDMGG